MGLVPVIRLRQQGRLTAVSLNAFQDILSLGLFDGAVNWQVRTVYYFCSYLITKESRLLQRLRG